MLGLCFIVAVRWSAILARALDCERRACATLLLCEALRRLLGSVLRGAGVSSARAIGAAAPAWLRATRSRGLLLRTGDRRSGASSPALVIGAAAPSWLRLSRSSLVLRGALLACFAELSCCVICGAMVLVDVVIPQPGGVWGLLSLAAAAAATVDEVKKACERVQPLPRGKFFLEL